MPKNVLIITASLRKNSNTDAIAAAFARGAQEAGHAVETVSLKDRAIGFCRGCMACQRTQRCVLRDDAPAIAERVRQADVLVFASPVYYYCLSGQLKTMLDRCNPLFTAEYAFRDVYLLTAAADAQERANEGAVKGMQGWVDCFERARLAGTVFAGGVDGPGEIAGHPALAAAYEMGRGIE